MAKSRDIISYYLKFFPKAKIDYENAQNQFERDLIAVFQNHAEEIENIKSHYLIFEEDHLQQYIRKELDYTHALEFVDKEYQELFDRIDQDFGKHEDATAALIDEENTNFQDVMKTINNLKKQAYQQYQEMISKINQAIDHEMQIHHDFIANESSHFQSMQKNYQEINSEQANRLLWTIEESKYALIALGKRLEDNSLEEAKFMNESVLQILESLRETKNKMTYLFKSTTDLFSKQKSKIERLNHERQKPHSLLNQSIIRQFVKQIRDVNQKKITFEQVIKRELKESLETLGRRILEYDASGNRLETEKAIMQYEIVQKKAEYLLNRNQAISDLLISKYQNEIKKIKIDSFRRVEEIKLAYFMPATFFQNSINLYSNFAFFVNESFDELDNLLSDLIRFNQQITEVKTSYVRQSAKTVEDYKIKVMVQANTVTTKLTDFISKIDVLSKEIITLESKNQLEVAEIRKKMENAEISGDYEKYLAELDNDEYFACYQHDINMQKIKSEAAHKTSLMAIERSVTSIHHRQQSLNFEKKHLDSLSLYEKTIHDLAYDQELALFYADYEKNKLEIDFKEKIQADQLRFQFFRRNYIFAKKYDTLRLEHLANQQQGSQQVIEYIHHTQEIIDLNDSQANAYTQVLEKNENQRDYAYFLENLRQKMLLSITKQTNEKTLKNRQAIQLYHHHFYEANRQAFALIAPYRAYVERLLSHLDNDFAINQATLLKNEATYLYSILSAIEKAYHIAIQSSVELMPHIDTAELFRFKQSHFEQFVILSHELTLYLQKPKFRIRKLVNVLERFYVETILLFQSITNTIRTNLSKSEIAIIRNDVLLVNKIENQAQATKKIVNNEYDRLIIKAVRFTKKKTKKIKHLVKQTVEIEKVLKQKVKKINEAYVITMADETKRLAFIKSEITKTMIENENAMKLLKKSEKSRYQLERKQLEIQYQDFVHAYQRMKEKSEQNYRLEHEYIERIVSDQQQTLQKSLVALDQQVLALPAQTKDLALKLSADKQDLIDKRREILTQLFAHIEGQKFLSRPKYLEEIEAIKRQLPENYVELYREIQKAETDFLNQYLDTEKSFSTDFTQFLLSQTNYRQILDRDNTPLMPFDKYLTLQTKLMEKTNSNFQETIDKSNLSNQLIHDEENKAKEKENRVING